MEKVLLHPCYFGPVSQFVAMAKAEKVIFENEDNFQKQTYRNRMYIYGANGKLQLNIPVKHTGNKSQHQKYKEVKIENDFRWQNQHWKSIQTVYRTSPFFEFYEDEFEPLYRKKFDYLLDFNYHCLEVALESLQLEPDISKTEEFILNPSGMIDGRILAEAKAKKKYQFTPYNQVFEPKFGYLNDLCIIDLIFNEGPNALNYLENQQLSLL